MMNWLDSTIAIRIGWTLVHSTWLIVLWAILYAIVEKMLMRESANVRYVVGCVALILMFASPIGWYFAAPTIQFRSLQGVELANSRLGDFLPFEYWRTQTVENQEGYSLHGVSNRLQGEVGLLANNENPPTTDGNLAEPLAPTHRSSDSVSKSRMAQALVWVTVAWVFGVLLFCVRPIVGLTRCLWFGFKRSDAPDNVVLAVKALTVQMQISHSVDITLSPSVSVPSVIGLFRPLILLPASAITCLTHRELEAIIAHELAHIRRHDYLANLIQTAIETLLFFHPAVWWVSKRIRIERENCCDDLAITYCTNRKTYAKALFVISSWRSEPQFGLAANGGLLANRIERIVKPQVPMRPIAVRHKVLTLMAATLAIAVPILTLPFAGVFHTGEFGSAENQFTYAKFDEKKKMSDDASKFWIAVQTGDTETARQILERDKSLAGKNFHPQSLHTDGFPLYHAAKQGNLALTRLLLEADADPDAKLEVEDPREVGMPLMNALHAGHFEVVHLILDYLPTLDAHPYCATPFVDALFNNMWDKTKSYDPGEVWQYRNDADDEVAALFGRSYVSYLAGETGDPTPRQFELSREANDDAPNLKLLRRVVELGGQPSLFTLVRHQQHVLIRELLTKAAAKKGAAMDWPQGTVFENICNGASWCGYPATLDDALELCPELYTQDVAKHAIERAIRSHNRDGGVDQYYALIESQLSYLNVQDAISESYSNGDPFFPLHWLAEDFIEPSHYGFKCEPLSTRDDLIRLGKLFVAFGFDINAVNPKTGWSALTTAIRESEMAYAEYLVSEGAKAAEEPELTSTETAFWTAVTSDDIETAERLLAEDSSLVDKNFPTGNPLFLMTDGFALHQAAKQNNINMVKLLLKHGADPDSKLDLETHRMHDHRELGKPLMWALNHSNFEMMNLLLDHGATVHAHPYCDVPFATRVFEAANRAGAPSSLVLRSIPDLDESFLVSVQPIANDAPEIIRLYDRILSLGATPNHYAIGQAGDYETVEVLLRHFPDGPSHDHWGGNVHEALLYGSAWRGNAKVVEMCMDICSDRHTTYAAAHCIFNALKSHNRPGMFEDYRRIIELNLDYLAERDAFGEHSIFLPLHRLADVFIGKNYYGPLGERPTVEHQLNLAQLCLDKGVDINREDAGQTALSLALTHGHQEYAEFLKANGARTSDVGQ